MHKDRTSSGIRRTEAPKPLKKKPIPCLRTGRQQVRVTLPRNVLRGGY